MGNKMFSSRIKELRTNKGLTMEQLASELGIGKSRISMWETNGTVPRMELLLQISQYFGVTTDYLLGNDFREPSDNAQISTLQRRLAKLDDKQLEKATKMLSVMFDDLFDLEDDIDDV